MGWALLVKCLVSSCPGELKNYLALNLNSPHEEVAIRKKTETKRKSLKTESPNPGSGLPLEDAVYHKDFVPGESESDES